MTDTSQYKHAFECIRNCALLVRAKCFDTVYDGDYLIVVQYSRADCIGVTFNFAPVNSRNLSSAASCHFPYRSVNSPSHTIINSAPQSEFNLVFDELRNWAASQKNPDSHCSGPVQAYLAQINAEKESNIRYNAIEKLMYHQDKRANGPLEDIARNDPSEVLRVQATATLKAYAASGIFPVSAFTALLHDLAQDGNAYVSKYANNVISGIYK